MPLFRRQDREAFGAGAVALALVAVVFAFGALLVVAFDDDDGDAAAAPAGSATVSLSEFALTPDSVTIPVGGQLTVTNTGTAAHNVGIMGTDLVTADLATGESATLDVSELEEGLYTMYCEIPGHKEAGMTGDLHVGEGDHGQHGVNTERLLEENDASDAAMKAPVDAYVAQLTEGANTEGVGNKPLEPKVLPDGTKEFDADGRDRRLGGRSRARRSRPGRTTAGSRARGSRSNPATRCASCCTTSCRSRPRVHFHGLELPVAMDGVPDVTQAPVKPGETFVYEFVAQGPALGMYHSHHHAEHQVPDGMLGVFQVGDVPLPGRHRPGHPRGADGAERRGRDRPLAERQVVPGDRADHRARRRTGVEINYFNEGLQIHPMHLHGIPQLVIAKDGFPLPQPYTVDTIDDRAGRAVHGARHVRPAEQPRRLGVPLPHPHPRRRRQRDVRHGHDVHRSVRRGRRRARLDTDRPAADVLADALALVPPRAR